MLNVTKTELVMFKAKHKKLDFEFNLTLNDKRIKIDKHLQWEDHIDEFEIKLNRAKTLLFKVREYVSTETLRPIYYAIFD